MEQQLLLAQKQSTIKQRTAIERDLVCLISLRSVFIFLSSFFQPCHGVSSGNEPTFARRSIFLRRRIQ